MAPHRFWGILQDGKIEFESLTDETLDGALDVMRKSFFLYENISVAVGLKSEPGASEELEELCLFAAKDGVSVIAKDISTNKVVGALFNKIQIPSNDSEKSYFRRFSDNCKHRTSKALVDFMLNIDSRVNLFEHYNVGCILELMFLATLPAYQRQRIGELLISSSLEIVNALRRGENVKVPVTVHGDNQMTNADAMPSLVTAIATSNYSMKACTRLHFERHLRITYDEFEFDGKKYSETIDQEHRDCSLMVKRPTST